MVNAKISALTNPGEIALLCRMLRFAFTAEQLKDTFRKTYGAEDVVLGNQKFMLQRQEFDYAALVSMRYFARDVTSRGWTSYLTELDLHIDGAPEPIRIRGGSWKESKGFAPRKLRAQLSARTIQCRLARWLKQMDEYGFIPYGKLHIYRDGRITKGDREINTVEAWKKKHLQRYPFSLDVGPSKSLIERAAQSFGINFDFSIPTEFDADVFYALLDTLYGIRWT